MRDDFSMDAVEDIVDDMSHLTSSAMEEEVEGEQEGGQEEAGDAEAAVAQVEGEAPEQVRACCTGQSASEVSDLLRM